MTDPGTTVLRRRSSAPAIIVLRWGAVGYGLVALAPVGNDVSWTDVVVLCVCVFLTTLRTLLPLDLGDQRPSHAWVALADIAVFSLAVGWTDATRSPWFFCVLVALAIAGFGWGTPMAITGGILAVFGVSVGLVSSGAELTVLTDDTNDLTAAVTLALAAAGSVFVRALALEVAAMARTTGGELTTLRAANTLLSQLSEVALTMPGAFTLREAIARIRALLTSQLQPRTIALVTLDEHNEEWTPKITDRCAMRASYPASELPGALAEVLSSGKAVTASTAAEGNGRWLAEDSRCGVYVPLRARDRVIGLLGLEHNDPHHFDGLDPVLRDGLADVIALTVDNARWFGRLRTLGAEEERIRVARDLHDRLGQWMTYIKLELEQIAGAPEIDRDELRRLQDDASEALDELRETLRQLRSGVSDDRPLAMLGGDLVSRFADRTDIAASFRVAHPDARLPVPVENELLRILQEALNNVDRHAKAEHVDIDWVVDGGNYELSVIDDGRGFDPDRVIREQSYGVIGMRERADVIGATLSIESRPGAGTRLSVRAGRVGTDQVGAARAGSGREDGRDGGDRTRADRIRASRERTPQTAMGRLRARAAMPAVVPRSDPHDDEDGSP